MNAIAKLCFEPEKIIPASMFGKTIQEIATEAYEGSSDAIDYLIETLVDKKQMNEMFAHAENLVDLELWEVCSSMARHLYGSAMDVWNVLKVHEDWQKLMALHANSDRPGNTLAAFEIADFFDLQECTEESFEWFYKAAQMGHEEAALIVGFALINGTVKESDVVGGVHWIMNSLSMERVKHFTFLDPQDLPINRVTKKWTDWELFNDLSERLPEVNANLLKRLVMNQPEPAQFAA